MESNKKHFLPFKGEGMLFYWLKLLPINVRLVETQDFASLQKLIGSDGKGIFMMDKWVNRFMPRVVCCFMTALMLAGGVAGCSYIPFIHSDKGEQKEEKVVRTLWKSGEQYVAIEKQDRPSGITVKANEHVTEISVDRLRTALASIDLRLPDRDKSIALFNDDELRILSEYIAEGLALAGPDEDVTFAIIGNYVEALGFLKKRMVSGGRVFCQDGQINIIFGDVHRLLGETMGIPEDRRLHPFMIGSRGGTVGVHEGMLLPKTGGEIFAKMREEWVLFPIKGPESLPTSQETVAPAPVTKEAAPASGQENIAPVSGTREVAPTAAPYAGKPTAAVKKSVEERLMILNELRNKKLISEEEYRVKRLDILNDL
jgi:hypothetical protein